MKRDYENNENNEINEMFSYIRLFRYFRLFRNLSSFLRLFQFGIDFSNTVFQSAHIVFLIFIRQLYVSGSLVGGFAVLLGLLGSCYHRTYKLPIFLKGVPISHRTMTGDDGLDITNASCCFGQCLGILHTTATIVVIDEGRSLGGK